MNAELLLRHFDRISEAPDAVARLRRFILDLAVRGKLVDQDPSDEPASALLPRIDAERTRLTKEEGPRREKPTAPIKEDEIPFSLPVSWRWVRLQSIASYIQRGKSPTYATGEGVPVVSQKCVQWRGLDLSAARLITFESLSKYEKVRFLREDDLLWNSTGTGTIGRVVRVVSQPQNLVCDSHVTVVRCALVNPEYVRLWLSSDHVYRLIEDRAAGSTNQVELTSQMATEQILPLPPLAEQHRIVAKVDELMALCDQLESAKNVREARRDRLVAASLHRVGTVPAAEGATQDEAQATIARRQAARFHLDHLPRLTTRPEHIKQLRQTILNLAIRGRLVPQDPHDEPATELRKRIRLEQARPANEKARKKTEALADVDPEQAPFDLPAGWSWARFPELGTFGRGKSKHRPRNDATLFEGGTHPLIQTGDVARSQGVIRTFTNKYNDTGLAQSMKWPAGTVCITIAANIADSGILSFDACFPDSVVGFIPASMFKNARYFEYFVRTAKANLLEFAPATAQKNINLEILNAVLIPIPPLAEQDRIVAKVDELMALCDQLESQLTASDADSRRLLEAVLRDALAA